MSLVVLGANQNRPWGLTPGSTTPDKIRSEALAVGADIGQHLRTRPCHPSHASP
jgi:hypothetical protein